ncbi:MAG: sulfatase, partial [Acidobacteriota bacterium]
MRSLPSHDVARSRRTVYGCVLLAAFAGCTPRSAPPVNVLLITIDTLRADRVGCYGYAAPTTPHIDSMAEEGVVFEKAIAQAPVTLPSHASLLTGTYPPTHGVRDNVTYQLSEASLTLAEVLEKQGYETAAFIGAFPLHRRFGLGQGFSHYDDRVGSQREAAAGFFAERRAEAVVDAALEGLGRVKSRPFFYWVHLFDPHVPYDPPSPVRERFRDSYDGEVAYVDSQVGRLLQGLERARLSDETLIVLTSDHGESLGDHGERTHGFFIYDTTMHVPLILRHPSLGRPRRVDGQVRSVDIMPTVLDLLQVPVPREVQGESLRPALAGEPFDRPAYTESYVPLVNFHWSPLRGLRYQGWKYIEAPRPELYDLSRDPDEEDNRFEAEPERAASLRRKLFAMENRFLEASKAAMRRPPDERT